jgi:hypothetical protein
LIISLDRIAQFHNLRDPLLQAVLREVEAMAHNARLAAMVRPLIEELAFVEGFPEATRPDRADVMKGLNAVRRRMVARGFSTWKLQSALKYVGEEEFVVEALAQLVGRPTVQRTKSSLATQHQKLRGDTFV